MRPENDFSEKRLRKKNGLSVGWMDGGMVGDNDEATEGHPEMVTNAMKKTRFFIIDFDGTIDGTKDL